MKKHPPALLGLLVMLSAYSALAATNIWNGPGPGLNLWSTGGNWTGGVPVAGDDLRFFDAGNDPNIGEINNVVDATFFISSLQFGQTNNHHTTSISANNTLSITNSRGLWVFTPLQESASTTKSITATITGPGTLNLTNSSASLSVNQGHTNTAGGRATLDLSSLSTFAANISRIGIGTTTLPNTLNPGGGAGNQRCLGTLLLAQTNLLTVNYAVPLATYVSNASATNGLQLSFNPGNNSSALSYLYLGLTNAIFIDSLSVGMTKASANAAGWMGFNPAILANSPVAFFRGLGGPSSRVTWWSVGDMGPSSSSSQVAIGTNDFTGGGIIDAMVETMSLGRDSSVSHTATGAGRINLGALKFDNGKIDVNTLIVGNQSLGPASSVTPNQGYVYVNGAGATLVVNSNLILANTTVSSIAATNTSGTLNINGGTVRARTISAGNNAASHVINMSGNATLVVTNSAGASKPLLTLSTSDSALQLHLTGASPIVSVTNLFTGGSANTINIGSSIVFPSYPAQVALLKYVTLSNNPAGLGMHNFTLGSYPANVVNPSLSNNIFNSSIDLYIPVDPRPVITNQPASYSGSPNDNVTFTVGATGVPPLSYQWRRDGTSLSDSGNLAGASTDTLSLTSAQPASNGAYTVVISNIYGSTTSSPPAQLTISSGNVAPSISGPTDQSVVQGNDATFTASVSGVPAPAIQWRKNGVDIIGANSPSYTVSNPQYPADEANYSIVATNVAGKATNSALLTVIVPPGINSQPVSASVSQGAPAAFTVGATGHPAPTFQWSRNNNAIQDATNSTYSIGTAQPGDAGNYVVMVSNPGGSTNSATVTLTVLSTNLSLTGFSPTNGATGICYDTPLGMTFSTTPVLGTGTLRIYDSTDTLVDTIDLGLNQANNAQTRTIGGGTYYVYPVIIRGNAATIHLHLGVITSNTTYYVLMDAGFFKDAGGASLPAITSTAAWRFSTRTSGPDPLSATSIVVARDGSGDFATVQGAIDWVPGGNATPITILVRKGTYEEINRIPGGKNHLTFLGEGCQESVITYANNNSFQLANAGTATRCMFYAGGNDLVFENLIFTNSTPQGGSQAESIRVQGQRIILDNCKLASFQDTVLINTANTSSGFFNKCLVQGDVDFIWGSGIGFFQSCEIRAMLRANSAQGINTQSRTANGAYGFIFNDCALTRSSTSVTNWTFGRENNTTDPTAGVYANVAWLKCRLDSHIIPGGWTDGGMADKSNLRFWEYRSTDITGTTLVPTNSRAPWSRQLDPSEYDNLHNPTNVFASIGWAPFLAPYVACQPTNQTAVVGQTVTIGTAIGGIPEPVYQWYKGVDPVANGTNFNIVIPNAQTTDSGTYSLHVTNDVGFVITSNAVLTVTVAVRPTITDPQRLGDGSFRFSFSGGLGQPYRVLATTDLSVSPFSSWSLVTSGVFSSSPVTITDTAAVNTPRRFYIISVP